MQLDHYKIEVNSIIDNFVVVSTTWWVKEVSAPKPWFDKDEEIYVRPPDFIERWLGITLVAKIEAAKKILKRRAELKLKKNQKLYEALK